MTKGFFSLFYLFPKAAFFTVVFSLCWPGCSRRGIGNAEFPSDGSTPDAADSEDCTRASDCVIAVPFDCCFGCPRVMTRSQLAEETCWYDQVNPPPRVIPVECLRECYACPTCFPQPLDVACVNGQCVADGEGCPGPTNEVYPEATVAEVRADQEAYALGTYTITGVVFPDIAACTGLCPAVNCCTSSLLLDGGMYLSGRPCDLEMQLWSDQECSDEFHSNQLETEGLLLGRHYEFVGEVIPTNNPQATPSLRVQSIRVLDEAPEESHISGSYKVTINSVVQEEDDPTCAPAPWQIGDNAMVYLAVAEKVRAFAPFFSCMVGGLFEGTLEGAKGFYTAVPILCGDCCCDYFLSGTVDGDTLNGQYESYDGTCRYTLDFTGTRL